MRVLVTDDSELERQLIVTLLESRYGATVVETESSAKAIAALKDDPRFDCVIGNAGEVFAHIREKQLGIPFILCSEGDADSYPQLVGQELAGVVGKEEMASLLPRLIESFQASALFHSAAEVTHCRVSIKVLRKIDFSNCDLFVRISGEKFLKIKNQGDPVDDELIARFEGRGVESLFIRQSDAAEFLAYLSQNVLGVKSIVEAPGELEDIAEQAAEKLGGDPKLKRDLLELANSLVRALERDSEIETALGLSAESQEQLRAAVRTLGMTPEIVLLVKASIRLTLQTIMRNGRLLSLFVKALKSGGSYFGARGTLVCYVSCALAAGLEWSSDFTRYKLSLAAYLHDILLDDRLARCRLVADLKSSTKAETELFAGHPAKTAALVRKMRDLPPDVDRIVLQHHERPDGSGFPAGVDQSRILPLSCVFIVAHDLVSFALERKAGGDTDTWPIGEFLALYGPQYEAGYFKKIQALLSGLPLG